MAQPTAGTLETLIGAATGPSVGQVFQARPLNRALLAFVTGTGLVSATVIYEVSMDGVNWATRATMTLPSTANYSSAVYVDTLSPFPFLRASLTAVAGTGAAVTCQLAGNCGS